MSMSKKDFIALNAPAPRPNNVCLWCDQAIEDDPAPTPCWITEDGDSGCAKHPISGEYGCGPHESREDVQRIVYEYHRAADPCIKPNDGPHVGGVTCRVRTVRAAVHAMTAPEYEYELRLQGGRVVTWTGHDGADAAMRAAECLGVTVLAWRYPRFYIGPVDFNSIID
jgi:hypothetical protein